MAKSLRCPNVKCRYVWNYSGNSKFQACCPRCGWKGNINSMVTSKPKIKKGKEK